MTVPDSAVPIAASRTRLRWRRRRGGPRQVSWLLVVPALTVALAVHFVAPGAGAVYAFTDWNGISPAKWIGLGNFREIFRTPKSVGS